MADQPISLTGTSPAPVDMRGRLLSALKGPANWFAMIAALSVVNSVLSMSGAALHFIFGLGLTQVIDAIAHQVGSAGYVLDLVINGLIAGFFLVIWNFARKGQSWAWYSGMALYALDGILCLFFQDYLSAAFHGWALYRMYPGLKLLSMLKQQPEPQEIASISSTFGN